jgi:decaprenyl-phosphate phosphoribosyltransferase
MISEQPPTGVSGANGRAAGHADGPPREPPPPPAGFRGTLLGALVEAMRPRQWTKNVLVFAGLLFTLDKEHAPADFARAGLAFVLFCALSAGVYLLNDLLDVEADRKHPKKRFRPIASGRLPHALPSWRPSRCSGAGWPARFCCPADSCLPPSPISC